VKTAPLDDPETIRRRRSSANRVLTILKAALNHAYDEGRVSNNSAWGRRVKPFRAVDVARLRFLTLSEAGRLINACDPDFRPLVRAALETGARYGELIALQAQDFNPDAGTLHVRRSKSGRDRHIVLTKEASAFFAQLIAGLAGDALIFRRASGGAWKPSQQGRPMQEASARARLRPLVNFHALRHTFCSLCVMNGVPLMVLAKNVGHVDTRMIEKHYGHLAPSYITDAIRSGAPRYGVKIKSKITPLRGGVR
jgi:integrase